MRARFEPGKAAPVPLPSLLYQNDPIRQSVQSLGRKWALLLVRDIAFLKLSRFVEFRRNNPGLSPRVLSRRLRELEREGILRREKTGKAVHYRLTSRGEDAGLILLAFLRYGLKNRSKPEPVGLPAKGSSPAHPSRGSA
ncbi:MAG: helix-turn-helix transcriptional regulator [Thermoplasmata archaeon]|nr:helix-turn-helix transcriptional regulator [Thermoplasmata archaeon]MCI4359712.1 helix-turn-helix transcriptional regulator [Thermoplasmata archaeon]